MIYTPESLSGSDLNPQSVGLLPEVSFVWLLPLPVLLSLLPSGFSWKHFLNTSLAYDLHLRVSSQEANLRHGYLQ